MNLSLFSILSLLVEDNKLLVYLAADEMMYMKLLDTDVSGSLHRVPLSLSVPGR